MHDTERIVRAYFRTYAGKDRGAIEALVSPDFRFTSPLDDHIDRSTYFEKCWLNSQHTVEHELERIFVEGDKAFVTYECKTTQGTCFRNTEFLVTREGQVTEVEVYFGWDIPRETSDSQSPRRVD